MKLNLCRDYVYSILPDGTAEIYCYAGSTIRLTIPARLDGWRVTSIGDEAFRHCSFLVSVTIPEGITRIGNFAFADCAALNTVVLPESITGISPTAFVHCDSLKAIDLPGERPPYRNAG